MSIVTEIRPLSSSRSQVYLDGEAAFVLYRGELRRFGVTQGEELGEEACREIRTQILPKRATMRCMNLLQKQEYTEKQLRDKLAQGGYPPESIEEALAYVKRFRYVDDGRYAEQFIACHAADRSRQRMRMDLLRRGIAAETVEAALERAQEETADGEETLLRRLLEKKRYDASLPLPEKQKIFAFLLRKGFSCEAIRRAMER